MIRVKIVQASDVKSSSIFIEKATEVVNNIKSKLNNIDATAVRDEFKIAIWDTIAV